jgi:RNA polymerase sigma-70 factor, ECF subfamily
MPRRSAIDDSAEHIGCLYDRFAAGLYRYALMLLADGPGAADVVHDVFVATLKGGADLEEPEHYLRRAVRNGCYSALRHRSRWKAPGGPLLEPVDANAGVDDRLMLDEAIRQLTAEQREVLHLKIFEGMTFQEIATTIDESINTVASRYRYALEKIKAVLGSRS